MSAASVLRGLARPCYEDREKSLFFTVAGVWSEFDWWWGGGEFVKVFNRYDTC